jgi:conjugative relaxase-like TrwC/TraI family protein
MLHIQGISAAQGWDYLTRQVLHAGDDYYAGSEDAQGERPGRWAGQSEVLLGLSGEVSEDLFRSVFGDRQHPQTGQTLGRARRTYQSIEERVAKARAAAAVEGPLGPEELAAIERRVRRTDRMSVDAFDATFSPVKSVSVLWAAMDPDGRREVEGAQQVAVDTALEVLRREAAYSRTGHHSSRLDANYSGRFEDTDGLVVAAFDHRMSRAGDPQLHTHAVVLNLARTSRDGAWRALDSRALHRAKDLAGAVYELTLMHELTNRLGVAWCGRTARPMRSKASRRAPWPTSPRDVSPSRQALHPWWRSTSGHTVGTPRPTS